MHNQHAGLSQALAEQRITERHDQAAHARLVSARSPVAPPAAQSMGGPTLVAAGSLARRAGRRARVGHAA